ncbi:MAG: hypothetical protein TREMPRED_001211 [Tremellales sp. Tagirdzhanova-0007]|nr:MAG: hypothetical protein TREMPRED_001211 [Tremellales sp. Tagirdzhanova-0007]
MASEAPSLPYARDEASTSRHQAAQQAHFSEAFEQENLLDIDDEDGDVTDSYAALQHWTAPRHHSRTRESQDDESYALPWRLKSRLKTFNAGLFICLNIGVDPPDVVKTNPCAKLECWLDPAALPAVKAIEAIGRNLQQQFETLNPKVKYQSFLDPSVEETKKRCVSLRRSAREERTVFYYNGHGVPKPTASGEIWVFNKISMYDLQDWLGR